MSAQEPANLIPKLFFITGNILTACQFPRAYPIHTLIFQTDVTNMKYLHKVFVEKDTFSVLFQIIRKGCVLYESRYFI